MSSIIVPIQNHPQFEQSDSEKLGDEITELCGYIYAATYHLLELIREFDEMRYWEDLGRRDQLLEGTCDHARGE
jgi:hypothetical protein